MKRFGLGLTMAGLLAGAAFAQGVSFAEVDANGDGAVSFDEAQAALPEITATDFTAADANGDGVLDETEFSTLAGG